MNVVVVESPAKAKTINKYLGGDYKVIASYGHVRDLPAKDGSVRPDADFDMSWEVDGKAEKHMKAIAEAVRGADKLFLATDPDREGEAISWHVREVLKARRVLKDVDVKRVVFNEVTRNAVLDAFRHPREIDSEAKARAAADAILAGAGFNVASVEHREVRRNPFPPFTTSTLQQEASRKLGFGATRTMQIAQRLYEGIDLDGDTVGLITYMRTDGVANAAEAIARSEEHTSELSHLVISYAVFCLKKKKNKKSQTVQGPLDYHTILVAHRAELGNHTALVAASSHVITIHFCGKLINVNSEHVPDVAI